MQVRFDLEPNIADQSKTRTPRLLSTSGDALVAQPLQQQQNRAKPQPTGGAQSERKSDNNANTSSVASPSGCGAAWASIVLQLLEAAKAGDVEVVCQLVRAYQNGGGAGESAANNINPATSPTPPRSSSELINCRDIDGRHSTPLHFAAGYNRLAVVEVLLKFGADVHAKDKGGLVPLHNACSYGHAKVSLVGSSNRSLASQAKALKRKHHHTTLTAFISSFFCGGG